MANHGIPNNSGRNRSDDEGEIVHSLHFEKRAKTDGNNGIRQESVSTPNDTHNGTVTPAASIPNGESVGSVFRYSRDLGTAGSIARRDEEVYQTLNDVDMQVAEVGSAHSGDEPEQSEEPEETNFTRIAGAKDRSLTVRIKAAALKGDTWQEKRKDLLALLVEIGIGTTTTVKQKKQTEGDYFEFAAQSEQEVAALLQVEFDTLDGFFKPDSNEGESIIARTVEVYGLAPRTNKEMIRLSLAKYGAVTSTTFRPCT
ncbi:hypothetical protein MVEG_03314 [Podila verticillata NRRL 6337]|nr:hypothetical protein MVEG_03314 [Podila verticillata NRRL 6337]